MPEAPKRSLSDRLRRLLWRLIVTTVGSCMRYRVTGLAAEAAFFAVLSMPPLLFALTGAIGYVTNQIPAAQVADVRQAVIDLASRALTEDAVNGIIVRTIDDVLAGGRFDVISIGFVLALWSGSRALNVFVDTITIMHGLGGHRGIIKTRALSFGLYILGLLIGVVLIPLVVAGPRLVGRILPQRLDFLASFYWPTVIVGCICFLATLYHLSVPVRTKWSFNLPGATFSLLTWILGSYLLRWVLTVTAGESRSIFGPLAAPIAVLLWLYIVALAVLIGAGVNAAFDTVFPQNATQRARAEVLAHFRGRWHDESGAESRADKPGADEPGADESGAQPAITAAARDPYDEIDRPDEADAG
ncbi:MAG: YihY/virulence factor BrkB family protein [Nocardioides sp.]